MAKSELLLDPKKYTQRSDLWATFDDLLKHLEEVSDKEATIKTYLELGYIREIK